MRGVENTKQYLKELQAGKHPEVSEKFKDGVIDTLTWVLDRKAAYPIMTNEMLDRVKAPKKEKALKVKTEKRAAKPKAEKRQKADKKPATPGFHPVPKPSQAA